MQKLGTLIKDWQPINMQEESSWPSTYVMILASTMNLLKNFPLIKNFIALSLLSRLFYFFSVSAGSVLIGLLWDNKFPTFYSITSILLPTCTILFSNLDMIGSNYETWDCSPSSACIFLIIISKLLQNFSEVDFYYWSSAILEDFYYFQVLMSISLFIKSVAYLHKILNLNYFPFSF